MFELHRMKHSYLDDTSVVGSVVRLIAFTLAFCLTITTVRLAVLNCASFLLLRLLLPISILLLLLLATTPCSIILLNMVHTQSQ